MNMKKIICLGMSVAMAAALAVPACAADAVNEDYGNTTDVVLKYAPSDTPYDDYDPEADGAFTITIPSQIDLTATDNGDKGVTIDGKGVIEFKGMIGQNDRVNLRVTSTNNYRLVDEATGDIVACYKMTASTTADDTSIGNLRTSYLTTPAKGDLFTGVDIMDTTGKDPGYSMSDNYAKAFQSEATIDLKFANSGPNNIFGKGEYTDTLTFDYKYIPYGKTADDATSTSLNINNGVDGTQTSDKDNTSSYSATYINAPDGSASITVMDNVLTNVSWNASNWDVIKNATDNAHIKFEAMIIYDNDSHAQICNGEGNKTADGNYNFNFDMNVSLEGVSKIDISMYNDTNMIMSNATFNL